MKHIQLDINKGQRPNIELTVRRVEPSTWYSLNFHKHHYLTTNLNKSCKCLLFEWEGKPIAFVGLLNTPRLGIPYGMSISRIVIMPDYQGLGLFRKICNFCGGVVKSLSDETHDYKLYIKTAHQKAGFALTRDTEHWKGTQFDGKSRTKESTEFEKGKYNNRLTRKSFCKEYIGKPLHGYEDLLLPIADMRKNKLIIKK